MKKQKHIIGDVICTTQQDIDNLDGVTSIDGDLDIYANVNDLNGLANITSISGDLFIGNNINLTNFDGLANLTYIGGNLYIGYNDGLTNLDGLTNIAIGGHLNVSEAMCTAWREVNTQLHVLAQANANGKPYRVLSTVITNKY